MLPMTLATALTLPLMGRPESWDGYGRTPLGDCPDTVLRSARRFFTDVAAESREGVSPRVREQLDGIALVLADREAHSPQQSLGFEVHS